MTLIEINIMIDWLNNLQANCDVGIKSDKSHELICYILKTGLVTNCELVRNENYIRKPQVDLDFSFENSLPYKNGWHDKKRTKNKGFSSNH